MDRDAVSSTMPLLVFRTPIASVAVNVAEKTREGRNDSGSQRAAGAPQKNSYTISAPLR